MTAPTVFPEVDTVRVMLYWDRFDTSDEDADEMEIDTDRLAKATAAIDLDCQLTFPNATVFISNDASEYAQWHSRVSSINFESYQYLTEAEEALRAIVDRHVFGQ